MVNGFMRPTAIKWLQHKHVQVVRNAHSYLRLRLPTSKRHSDPIVTMPMAVKVYARMLQRVAGITAVGSATNDQLERRLRHGETWLRRR